MNIIPVVMAGGTGSRLWPLSRELYPKQFLAFDRHSSMLQATVDRLNGFIDEIPLVVCNDEHRFIAAEQLRQADKLNKNIILEPFGKNTAPTVTVAALHAVKNSGSILLVLAADHIIEHTDRFHSAVKTAFNFAEKGRLVTFGIEPSKPETGYGYIKKGDSVGTDSFNVDRFVEKPDLKVAEEYLASHSYLWNSGMFMFRADRFLEEMEKFRPDILDACEKAYSRISVDNDFIRLDKDAFGKCPAQSVDYAVMEKTSDAVVVAMNAGWDDLGSWSAMWKLAGKDAEGNAIVGDVIQKDTKNSYIRNETGMAAVIGVEDLVVVQTKDALLVVSKDKVQDVKSVVERMKDEGRQECVIHREVHRPWGKYDSIGAGDGYKVKKITVNPGARLSLQKHLRRSEHWVVVSGAAKVRKGDEIFTLNVNESIYISKEEVHSLENQGSEPLTLIEVQCGDYLEEDDIIRLEDMYGRK